MTAILRQEDVHGIKLMTAILRQEDVHGIKLMTAILRQEDVHGSSTKLHLSICCKMDHGGSR